MYLAFKHLHLATAILSLPTTVAWVIVAWRGQPGAVGGWRGRARLAYVGHRAVAGLAALTGLAVTFVGPWQAMIFPYVGLAAFVVHGLAATDSKRSLASAHPGRRQLALLTEIAALVFSAWLMNAKPF